MKALQSKPFQWGIFGLIIIIAAVRSFMTTSPTKHKLHGYDEQMWTSSAIASYHMYFKGHVRETKELDNWFATYAWRNQVPVFTGEEIQVFQPDTVEFPYDFVTVKQGGQAYSIVVKYDVDKFPRKMHQWYDRDMWTFGWKAPNMGKYIMGWCINTFASSKPDPNGYFSYYIPEQYVDSLDSDKNVPSTVLGNATFSYAPEEYLIIARRTNAIFTMLTIAVTFLLGWWFMNYWVGLISAAWLTLNETFLNINSVIGLDSFAVFFSMAALFCLILTLNLARKNVKWWKILVSGSVTGLLIGFAVSSKLNAGMLVYVAFVLYVFTAVLLLLKNRKKGAKKETVHWKESIIVKGLVSGVLIGGLSVGSFVMLNPQVQGDVPGKVKTVQQSIDDYFSRRARNFTQNQIVDRMKVINAELIKLTQEQKMDMNAANGINTRLQQVNAQLQGGLNGKTEEQQHKFLLKRSGKLIKSLDKLEADMQQFNPEFVASKSEFMNWVSIKDEWPAAFSLYLRRTAVVEDKGPDVRFYGTFGSLAKFPYNSLDGIFAIVGLIFLLLIAYKETRKEMYIFPAAAILISFLIITYGNVDFIWQDWPRYMTPTFPLFAIMIGIGIVEGTKFVQQKMKERKEPKPQPEPVAEQKPQQQQKKKKKPKK